MPGGDGTGPRGRGPMTGRGMGYCVVKLPADGGDSRGRAGVAGRPVETRAPGMQKITFLQRLAESLHRRLERTHARINAIEKSGD